MPVSATLHIPWKRISWFALFLNTMWEFAQCSVLFDMRGWGLSKGTVWMWGAIAGDVLIVLGVVAIAKLVSKFLFADGQVGRTALVVVGLFMSILLEWIALELQLWSYSDVMPTLSVWGTRVGLSPIIQITVLPAASYILGTRARSVVSLQ